MERNIMEEGVEIVKSGRTKTDEEGDRKKVIRAQSTEQPSLMLFLCPLIITQVQIKENLNVPACIYSLSPSFSCLTRPPSYVLRVEALIF